MRTRSLASLHDAELPQSHYLLPILSPHLLVLLLLLLILMLLLSELLLLLSPKKKKMQKKTETVGRY